MNNSDNEEDEETLEFRLLVATDRSGKLKGTYSKEGHLINF